MPQCIACSHSPHKVLWSPSTGKQTPSHKVKVCPCLSTFSTKLGGRSSTIIRLHSHPYLPHPPLYQYEDHEEVVVWMNTVGPYHNRQETYNYFSLPFCKGPQAEISHYHETLGEALQGVELEFSGLQIGFKGGNNTLLCTYSCQLLFC